jgi:hypothetical protein|nr:MAG TPA: hypothetical protein [Caudoviricetes sp.]
MNRSELNKFIQQSISEQGNVSSIALTQLAIELMKHVPCTVHISDDKTEDLDKTTYKITDSQEEIDTIIDVVIGNEVSSICMHDNGVTLHFSHIEVSDDIVTCYLTTFDGNYTLLLRKKKVCQNCLILKLLNKIWLIGLH